MQGRRSPSADVEELAKLPPLDVLRGQVLGAIVAPLTHLLGLVNAPLQNLIGLIDARIEQLEARATRASRGSAGDQAEPEPEADRPRRRAGRERRRRPSRGRGRGACCRGGAGRRDLRRQSRLRRPSGRRGSLPEADRSGGRAETDASPRRMPRLRKTKSESDDQEA